MTKTLGRSLALVVAVAVGTAGCVARPAGAPPSPTATAAAIAAPATAPATQPAPSVAPMTAEEFWASLFAGDPDFATYPSLQALATDSDAVVVGSFAGLETGPTYAGEYGGAIVMGALTLKIDRVLHGEVQTKTPGTLVVLLLLGFRFAGHEADPWQERLASLQGAMPAGRGVFFLANMAAGVAKTGGDPKRPEADPYMYQVMSSQGYLRDVAGKVEAPIWHTSGWPESLRGRSFEDVVIEIERIRPVP